MLFVKISQNIRMIPLLQCPSIFYLSCIYIFNTLENKEVFYSHIFLWGQETKKAVVWIQEKRQEFGQCITPYRHIQTAFRQTWLTCVSICAEFGQWHELNMMEARQSFLPFVSCSPPLPKKQNWGLNTVLLVRSGQSFHSMSQKERRRVIELWSKDLASQLQ